MLTRRIVGLGLLLGVIGVALHAQAPTPAATSTPPALTELERTKVELLQVRTAYAQLLAQYDACKAEVGSTYNTLGTLRARAASEQLSAEEREVTATIDAGHAGWTWDSKTGLFAKIPPPVPKKPGPSDPQ